MYINRRNLPFHVINYIKDVLRKGSTEIYFCLIEFHNSVCNSNKYQKQDMKSVTCFFFQFVRTKNTEINNSHRKKFRVIFTKLDSLFIFGEWTCLSSEANFFFQIPFFDTAPRLTPRFEAVSRIKFIKLFFRGGQEKNNILYSTDFVNTIYPDFKIVYIVYGI